MPLCTKEGNRVLGVHPTEYGSHPQQTFCGLVATEAQGAEAEAELDLEQESDVDLGEQANADAEESAKDAAEVDDGHQAELEREVELGAETEEDFEVDMAIPFAAVSSDRDADSEPQLSDNQELSSKQTEQAELDPLDGTESSIYQAFDVDDNGGVISTAEASIQQSELDLDGSLELQQDGDEIKTAIAGVTIAVPVCPLLDSSNFVAGSRSRSSNGRGLNEEAKRNKDDSHSGKARHSRLEGHFNE